jgi:protein-S-isoprenylcysteine O-methyltransferase Ste14
MTRFLRRTPVQTFLLVPLATLAVESMLRGGPPAFAPVFVPLMAWGYAQYRWSGAYRLERGGGGPGLSTPPERVVDTGIYAWTRNPMYLGHIVYMAGVALAFQSWFGAVVALARAVWFHLRVLRDEKRLTAQFGEPYNAYMARVRRWLPLLF